MQNFTFHNRTRIVFGEGTIGQLGALAAPYGKRALFVYGQGSIKQTGVYDQAVASLKAAGIEIVEYADVRPNPTLTHAREGAALARREKVDMVVAVGGGSVIDEAKAIAAGAVSDADIWDFFLGQADVVDALPIFAVLTLAAAGSEMNGGLVLTNEATQQKLGMVREPLQPIASILDPSTTFTVNSAYTAYSAVDACCHLLESYLTRTDPYTPVQDRYVEGLVQSLMETCEAALADPSNYQARAAFMWGATLAWNGIAPAGVGPHGMPNHFIGHSMSALYDTPHGASLSVSLPAWMAWRAKQDPSRVARFAREVFNIHTDDVFEEAGEGIEALLAWFQKIGSPTTLSEAGIPVSAADAIAENAASVRERWGLPEYTKKVILEILAPAVK